MTRVYTVISHTSVDSATYLEYEDEDNFWVELRHTQKMYKEQNEPGILLALVPKEAPEPQQPSQEDIVRAMRSSQAYTNGGEPPDEL